MDTSYGMLKEGRVINSPQVREESYLDNLLGRLDKNNESLYTVRNRINDILVRLRGNQQEQEDCEKDPVKDPTCLMDKLNSRVLLSSTTLNQIYALIEELQRYT